MNALFDSIVDLLLAICRHTGLSYPEINILIYCGIIPAAWAGILCLRQRRFWWILALHGCLVFCYLQMRQFHAGFSNRFYEANIAALEWGASASGLGYIGISLLTGMVFPLIIYGLLLIPPRRWTGLVYAALILGNATYYFWVLCVF